MMDGKTVMKPQLIVVVLLVKLTVNHKVSVVNVHQVLLVQ
jgi:hypothetical protein